MNDPNEDDIEVEIERRQCAGCGDWDIRLRHIDNEHWHYLCLKQAAAEDECYTRHGVC